MAKRILIILGHPDKKSLNGAFADAYAKGAARAKAEVRRINLGDLKFDPILHEGYNKIQQLEPDLIKAQKDIEWANHLVFIYPTWWGQFPALMKGFFDRTFHPQWAFRFTNNGKSFDSLLKGRSARLIVTMGGPKILAWFLGSPMLRVMKWGILRFCGIHPTRCILFGLADKPATSEAQRRAWIAKVERLGERCA